MIQKFQLLVLIIARKSVSVMLGDSCHWFAVQHDSLQWHHVSSDIQCQAKEPHYS